MERNEYLAYKEKLHTRGIVPGLSNMEKMLSIIDGLPPKCNCIHIAGTNGKGSVGAFISSCLSVSGYKTAHYYSPAIEDYTDNIKINCENLNEEKYLFYAEKLINILEKHKDFLPTEFEFETGLFFTVLKEEKCDFAVIECGMGGMWDATNVIPSPLVSVLTSISMEHSKFLGSTIEDITRQKAGIIKNSKAFSSPQCKEAATVLEEYGVNFVDNKDIKNIFYNDNNTVFDYKDIKDINIYLKGKYQCENAAITIEVMKFLKEKGFDTDIKRGLESTHWHYRFEEICHSPTVILDGAHNPAAFESLKENIKLYFNNKKVLLVMGVFKDKDYNSMLKTIAEVTDTLVAVDTQGERGLEGRVLAKKAKEYIKNLSICENVTEVVGHIEKYAYDVLIYAGSFSFLAKVRKNYE